jgi:hypothetical protein
MHLFGTDGGGGDSPIRVMCKRPLPGRVDDNVRALQRFEEAS